MGKNVQKNKKWGPAVLQHCGCELTMHLIKEEEEEESESVFGV